MYTTRLIPSHFQTTNYNLFFRQHLKKLILLCNISPWKQITKTLMCNQNR